jgi:NADPH:quinone reductase-like Zn-dependent oxidoreductase
MSTDVDLVTFMGKSARVQAIDVGSRQMFEDMNRAIHLHTLHSVVDRVFGFSELGAALKCLGEARHLGKVCLRI